MWTWAFLSSTSSGPERTNLGISRILRAFGAATLWPEFIVFASLYPHSDEPGCKSNSDCKDGGEICQGGKCLPGCRRNKDCKEEENCQDGSCVDLCNSPNACGTNALCKSTKHKKGCSCPPNLLGNPEVECLPDEKGKGSLADPRTIVTRAPVEAYNNLEHGLNMEWWSKMTKNH